MRSTLGSSSAADQGVDIIANHRARLFGSGIGDRATLEYLGAVLGEEQIQRVATHRQRLEIDLGSRTDSHDFERLAAPNRIREAQAGSALLVYGNRRPPGSRCAPGTATGG